MLSRNPGLHFVFARMGMAEEQGLGIRSLRDRAKELGLPLPRYTWDAPYLVLRLYRSTEAAAKTLDQDVLKSLSKSEPEGLAMACDATHDCGARVRGCIEYPQEDGTEPLETFHRTWVDQAYRFWTSHKIRGGLGMIATCQWCEELYPGYFGGPNEQEKAL
jgi:hypothetical protein